MKVLLRNEEHLGGALCYPCNRWLVYSREDVQIQKRKIYKVENPFDISSDGHWEEIDCTVIVCPNCSKSMLISIIR